jgi:S-DNA-T family DNA segregation ATPase FtsK/SpoIIIE
MNLTLIRDDRVFTSSLPDEVTGKHWLCDVDAAGRQRRLASIEAEDGRWIINPHGSTTLTVHEGTQTRRAELTPDTGLYTLETHDGTHAVLLAELPLQSDKIYTKLGFKSDIDITIGRAADNLLCFYNTFVSAHHALLRLSHETFSITNTHSANGVYINGWALPANVSTALKVGDVIFIMGLKIAIGSRFIAYNNPHGLLTVKAHPAEVAYVPQEKEELEELLQDPDGESAFYRSPRIKRDIESKTFDVEDPPAREKQEESPTILKIGPSIGMALGSAMMGLYMVSNLATGGGSILRALPMLGMMVVMILGAVLWPNLTRRYEKRKAARDESKRKAAYATYLDKLKLSLIEETALQKEILEQNRITVAECLDRTATQDRRLFERTAIQSDFLELRIGRGDAPLVAEVKFPADKLALDEDVLKDELNELRRKPRIVADVPLSLALQDDFVCGIVGNKQDFYPFMRGLIAQIGALHAPDEVKFVFFGDTQDEQEWSFIRALPHIFDDAFSARFLACDKSEADEVSLRLEREVQQRMSQTNIERPGDYGAYYVVFVANRELASTTEVIARLNALRSNKGFSVVTFAEDIRALPKECRRIIELEDISGCAYDPKDASGNKTDFISDISLTTQEAKLFAEALALLRLDIASARTMLPQSLGFLEMFEAGRVEHLNIKTRWAENNPTRSLASPLGIDPQGELSMLDIHEDFHGPHGLVAGMTGSGKSETIITYILSLAVNFRPDEVSFVLIDYKGGGLAGAFDNDKARLPHLAGTITNLDGAAIARSLISINSELKRRQALFNTARDNAGLGTMDIYKYQELYRQGQVAEPCPHMLIISDEFAELKAQQPEFMDQLISAARIGRSLGVHLILATQKPSGVVNDQIWSNSRFKVCLKVADVADSREMLKRPDAAELVDAGRFYLQVGYNEYFALGQSAYAGATYRPQEHFEKKHDDSVVLISNTARPLLAARPEQAHFAHSSTPESVAVLHHLVEVAAEEGLEAPRLWLDPIPEVITVDELDVKYPRPDKDPFTLDPILGEYDDPYTQSQNLLSLPLTVEGNAIIYGSTGSGKATLLSSMLYSLLKDHTAKSLNVYILDFGAETLGAFRSAPQVGDVLFTGDEEKVERLFVLLEQETATRKRKLAGAGGLGAYNRHAPEVLPSIVVVLNDVAAFYELYPALETRIVTLTRDGSRLGIHFVVTASSAASVRMRLRSNFRQLYALPLNDENDYSAVLGSIRGTIPPKTYARGLVVSGKKLLEFQGAFPLSPTEDQQMALTAFAAALAKPGIKGVGSIPTLPDRVTAKSFLREAIALEKVPVGIFVDDLQTAFLDLKSKCVHRIIAQRKDGLISFARGLLEVLRSIGNVKIEVIDTLEIFGEQIISGLDCSSEGNPFESLYEYLQNEGKSEEFHTVLVVSGFSEIMSHQEDSKVNELQIQLAKSKLRANVSIIALDVASDAAKVVQKPWFQSITSNTDGLWIGNGVTTQNAVQISYSGRISHPEVSEHQGFLIEGTRPAFMQVLTPESGGN